MNGAARAGPRLLALDAATAALSVAVWSEGRIVARLAEGPGRRHAERLVPMVEAVLAAAGLGYADLDAFAATVGPGSFTGVRIGLGAARGLALAAAKPLIGVTTLEALAWGRGAACVAVIASGRDLVFVQAFHAGGARRTEPALLRLDDAAAIVAEGDLLIGDAAAALAAVTGAPVVAEATHPDAGAVAALAARRFAAGPPAAVPVPLYLRPPDAKPMAARDRDA
jgi:tRNA threonylcarbamoyl adenosine modification protein YeaZ